jgi:hypothetical protein
VTSLSRLLDRHVTVAEVRPLIRGHLAEVFSLAFEPAPAEVADTFSIRADVA